MSRLKALLAALPEILAVVEPISDGGLQFHTFDLLAQAAIDDAAAEAAEPMPMPMGRYGQVLVADPSAPQGVSWGSPSNLAAPPGETSGEALDANSNRLLLTPANAASAEMPQPGAVYNAVADFDGTRQVGTYTMDSPTTGTFTPAGGADRMAWATTDYDHRRPAMPPHMNSHNGVTHNGDQQPASDSPMFDETARSQRT